MSDAIRDFLTWADKQAVRLARYENHANGFRGGYRALRDGEVDRLLERYVHRTIPTMEHPVIGYAHPELWKSQQGAEQ